MSDARRTYHQSLRKTKRTAFLTSVRAAIEELQPGLKIVQTEPQIVISGVYLLTGPEGPFDQFHARILVGYGYPNTEPALYETGGRIPVAIDRHVNTDGTCCVTVWEEWLANADSTSFRSFLQGPIHEFFLSQWWFERTKKWRFGERAHGKEGLLAAYAEALSVGAQPKILFAYLRILLKAWPKGHYMCPCGSAAEIRDCHGEVLTELHRRIPPKLARRMMRRLKEYTGEPVRRRRPHRPQKT